MIIYFSVALGVVISIVLPLIRPLLPKPPKVTGQSKKESKWSKAWKIIRPYAITGLFSLIVALLIVAFFGETIDTWQKGLLAGYTADSTLQKLSVPKQEN